MLTKQLFTYLYIRFLHVRMLKISGKSSELSIVRKSSGNTIPTGKAQGVCFRILLKYFRTPLQ